MFFKNFLFSILLFVSLAVASDAIKKDDAKNTESSTEKPKEEPKIVTLEHTLSIAVFVLPHSSLKNSKSLHNWPFLAFAVPTWNTTFKASYAFTNLISLNAKLSLDPSVFGLGVLTDINLNFLHLIDIGIAPSTASAWNYGNASTFMGVYDANARDYRQDAFMTEYTYGIKYKGALTLPLLAILPKSDWTKIILKGSIELEYAAYTGANDGEVWKAGAENCVNGYKHKFGTSILYMLPFKRINMAMLSVNVGGFNKSAVFDSTYSDYNPYFKTIAITPMLMFKAGEKWNGMFMANFARKRKYENMRYEASEELLQKYIDSEWNLNVIMLVFSRKF